MGADTMNNEIFENAEMKLAEYLDRYVYLPVKNELAKSGIPHSLGRTVSESCEDECSEPGETLSAVDSHRSTTATPPPTATAHGRGNRSPRFPKRSYMRAKQR